MKLFVLTVVLVIGTALANNTFVLNINDETSIEFIFSFDYSYEDDFAAHENKLPAEEKINKNKCHKLTGSDEVNEKFSVDVDVYGTCVKSQFNVAELQEDIINAKLPGDLDSVFGKYCRKTPTVITCVKDFLPDVDPCLETIEKMYRKIVINLTECLIDFLCYKDGHRFAMFIAEGGLKCIQDKEKAMEGCAKKILGKKTQIKMPGVDNLPFFIIENELCYYLPALQTCVVTELKGCSKPTSANLVDALFKFIKKLTNCEKVTVNHKCVSFNNANVVISSIFMFAITLFVRYF